jgi:hypothetical protein
VNSLALLAAGLNRDKYGVVTEPSDVDLKQVGPVDSCPETESSHHTDVSSGW